MPGWLKIILIIFGVLALIVVGLSITGYYWVKQHSGDLKAGAEKVQKDGEAFGRGKTVAACIDEGLARLRREPGIIEQVRTQMFLQACQKTAAPSPEICEGVPEKGEIMATSRWSVDQCRKRGLEGNQGCAQMFTVVAGECHGGSK